VAEFAPMIFEYVSEHRLAMTGLPETDDGVFESLAPATGASTVKGFSGARPTIGNPTLTRSEADDFRICIHEMSHATVGRIQGNVIGGATCVAGADFAGLCWGPAYNATLPNNRSAPRLFEQLRAAMPAIGESRMGVADIFLHVHNLVVECAAGEEGERLFCEGPPHQAIDDNRQAHDYAALICTGPYAVEAFVAFCRVEAAALLTASDHVVHALASTLRIERTMNGSRIDQCIAEAVAAKALLDERQRQSDWRRVVENAARFGASMRNPS
jgi:hypothetical protein